LADVARDTAAAHRADSGAANPSIAGAIARRLSDDTRPEPLAPLRQGAVAAALGPTTRVRARHGLRYTLTTGGSCSLTVMDKTVTLPGSAADALALALDGAPFTPADLPGLDEGERLVLVRQLLRDGVVVAAEPAP
jgi:bifunctional lysine-specific demethylase and histidyl-hydroxylase NO66